MPRKPSSDELKEKVQAELRVGPGQNMRILAERHGVESATMHLWRKKMCLPPKTGGGKETMVNLAVGVEYRETTRHLAKRPRRSMGTVTEAALASYQSELMELNQAVKRRQNMQAVDVAHGLMPPTPTTRMTSRSRFSTQMRRRLALRGRRSRTTCCACASWKRTPAGEQRSAAAVMSRRG